MEQILMQAIQVQNLTHQYDKTVALDHIHFSVKPNTFFGLIGPNGSGKSTLFKILSSLLRPTSGNVSLFGFDLTKSPEKIRELIGIVFQNPALDKKLTVYENLLFQGYLYPIPKVEIQERISELSELLQLGDLLSKRVETLSGGFQRRVEIAKALLPEPKILLLDEPTTGLDPIIRKELWDYLKALHKKTENTIVVTTHHLEEADTCDEILLLDHGKILAFGNPRDLKKKLTGWVLKLEPKIGFSKQRELEAHLGISFKEQDGILTAQVSENTDVLKNVLEQASDFSSVTLSEPSLFDFYWQQTVESRA